MVSTRKKRQSDGRLLSQLDDFDQANIIGYTMSDRQQNATVNEGTVDEEFTVGNSDSNPAVNENLVNVKMLWLKLSLFLRKLTPQTFSARSVVIGLYRLCVQVIQELPTGSRSGMAKLLSSHEMLIFKKLDVIYIFV